MLLREERVNVHKRINVDPSTKYKQNSTLFLFGTLAYSAWKMKGCTFQPTFRIPYIRCIHLPHSFLFSLPNTESHILVGEHETGFLPKQRQSTTEEAAPLQHKIYIHNSKSVQLLSDSFNYFWGTIFGLMLCSNINSRLCEFIFQPMYRERANCATIFIIRGTYIYSRQVQTCDKITEMKSFWLFSVDQLRQQRKFRVNVFVFISH